MFVAYEGERDSIRLNIPGGDGGRRQTLAPDAFRRKFEGTGTNVFSANYSKPIAFDLAVSAAGGKQYVSVRRDRVLKVLQ